jgi:chromosome segregation ATPase
MDSSYRVKEEAIMAQTNDKPSTQDVEKLREQWQAAHPGLKYPECQECEEAIDQCLDTLTRCSAQVNQNVEALKKAEQTIEHQRLRIIELETRLNRLN